MESDASGASPCWQPKTHGPPALVSRVCRRRLVDHPPAQVLRRAGWGAGEKSNLSSTFSGSHSICACAYG
eukprot:4598840-Pyramimonas_sp.AAC.1